MGKNVKPTINLLQKSWHSSIHLIKYQRTALSHKRSASPNQHYTSSWSPIQGEKVSPPQHLLAGGVAEFIKVSAWYPLDTIKIRMQLAGDVRPCPHGIPALPTAAKATYTTKILPGNAVGSDGGSGTDGVFGGKG